MYYTHLTLEDRIGTFLFVGMCISCREIAVRLGRSHTTVSCELRRSGGLATIATENRDVTGGCHYE